MYQQTIAEKVSCTGTGLHSGAPVHLTLYPARANSGIVFVRTDLGTPMEIPARVAYRKPRSLSLSARREVRIWPPRW